MTQTQRSSFKHHLKTLRGETVTTWLTMWPEWRDIQDFVSSYYECEPDEVGTLENDEGGEFITIDGIPVCYLEHERKAPAQVIALPVRLMAAE